MAVDTVTLRRTRGFERISESQWLKDSLPDVHGSIDSVILPYRKTFKSAGHDIFSTLDFTLAPNKEVLIPLGFKVYMQEDEFLSIHPRSGLGFKYYFRLANLTGIIDSDYHNNSDNEGHCFAKMRNEGNKIMKVKKGDGIAQCVFQKYLLSDNESSLIGLREGGFGSTG